ncbi:hypothetical protein MOV75_31895, partial [Bradyrhizobium sp. PRIMUS42]|nr:hypothetical protein [Bradyrhizobium sp. PRIMUS42]
LVSDDGQTMIGSLFLIEAPGRGEVEAFNRADPFAAAVIKTRSKPARWFKQSRIVSHPLGELSLVEQLRYRL